MYNTNTASVNLKVTALTSDTLYRLADILTGDRYATLQFTAEECRSIEMNAYAANMGTESKESAWVRFCELCTADKAISDEVKDRLGMEDLNRYEVRTFTVDGDSIIFGQCFANRTEAIETLAEAMSDSEAHHGMVYDDLSGDATYSIENKTITDITRNSLEQLLIMHERRADRESDRVIRYHEEGDEERAVKASHREDLAITAIDAITQTLCLMGYGVHWTAQDGKNFPHIFED